MSESRSISLVTSSIALKSEDEEFVVVEISPEHLKKHAQEIEALKKLHAAELAKLKKSYDDKLHTVIESYEETSANETLTSSIAFNNLGSAELALQEQVLQNSKDLQLELDQLRAENEAHKSKLKAAEAENLTLKSRLLAAETNNNTNKPFNAFSRLGCYTPMFYPLHQNLRSLTGTSIFSLQQRHLANQESSLEDSTPKSDAASAPTRPQSPR